MNEYIITEIFNLNKSYLFWKQNNLNLEFSQSIKLITKFSSVYENQISKLPYRLNLLDDLSTNENAHSKFLIRLLQHQPALKNFLTFINIDDNYNFSFDTSIINKPLLTYEVMRIDGLIRENNKYAIIIENKIHNAVEQEHQIGRYINKCKSIGFNINQIYIIYLTKTKSDSHSNQTWGEYDINDFNTRYTKISYKSKILPWLEHFLNSLSSEEELIKSAIVQYIDHLKHFFNNKQIYFNMNTELQNFLSTELNLSSDNAENIEIVERKINEIKNLNEQLAELSKVSKKKLFEDWKKNLNERFESEGVEKFYQTKDSLIKTGIVMEYNGKKFSVLVEYNYNSIYFGFGRHYSSEKFEPEIIELLKTIIEKENLKLEEPWWYGWKHTTFNNGYLELENLIKIVQEKINEIN
jgi:hypothetical protein